MLILGGSNNTIYKYEYIKNCEKEIGGLFVEYNTRYRQSKEPLSMNSESVTNISCGEFWIGCSLNINYMKNREVIEKWREMEAAKEESQLLLRDITLLRAHCKSDVELLSGAPSFLYDISEEERKGFACILKRRVNFLKVMDAELSKIQL